MSNGINSPYGLIAVESVSGSGATRKMKSYSIATPSTIAPIFYGDPVKFQPFGANVTSNWASGGLNIINALTPSLDVNGNSNGPATLTAGKILGSFIGCEYKSNSRTIESNYWPGAGTVDLNSPVTFFINDDPDTIFKVQMSTSDTNASVTNLNSNSGCIFQNWMIGQNAMLQIGGTPFTSATIISNNPLNITLPQPTNNPINTNNLYRSNVYLDGVSISLLMNGITLSGALAQGGANYPPAGLPTAARGNPDFDVKIIGLAPSSSQYFGSGTAVAPYNKLVPGINMPFCDLLVKFNNHVYSAGVPGIAWNA